jgi:hypothetical protein
VGALAEHIWKATGSGGEPPHPEEHRTSLQLEAIRRLLEAAGSNADPATAGQMERGVLGEPSVLLRLGGRTAVIDRDGRVSHK